MSLNQSTDDISDGNGDTNYSDSEMTQSPSNYSVQQSPEQQGFLASRGDVNVSSVSNNQENEQDENEEEDYPQQQDQGPTGVRMPAFAGINNVGNRIGNLPNQGLAAISDMTSSLWTRAMSGLGGSVVLPSVTNSWFRLKTMLLQPRSLDQDLYQKDLGAPKVSVQYYSQDDVDNFRIKVSIQRVNELSDGSSKKLGSQVKNLQEASKESKKKFTGSRKNTAVKLMETRMKRLEKLKRSKKSSFARYVSVLKWQEKVLSPRELCYYAATPEIDLENEHQHAMKKQVTEIMKKFQDEDYDNSIFKPYHQNSHVDDWGSHGMDDLLDHMLFTYVEKDDFETDELTEEIVCHSKVPYPKSCQKAHLDSDQKYQTMYIMSNMGTPQKVDGSLYQWKGSEFCICKIKVYDDGSFDMKPGLSSLPSDVDNLENKWTKKRLKENKNEELEKSFMFRMPNGYVYAYTIHLYNSHKKIPEVDRVRKEVLAEMYQRSLGMKQNLVGHKFQQHPLSEDETRYHLMGEILSGHSFEADKYSIRYFCDIPECYEIEKISNSNSTTQLAYARAFDHDELVSHFSHPFECHLYSRDFKSPPIRIYFEVTSRDNWNRYRVEGYGHLNIRQQPGVHEYTVQTWKPKGSMVDDLRSWFVGGSCELQDVTFSGIPTGFTGKYLNKYGVLTETSGQIKVRIQLILQRMPKEAEHEESQAVKNRFRPGSRYGRSPHGKTKEKNPFSPKGKPRRKRSFLSAEAPTY